ncbi:hypothetical protein [Arthrobacter sp. zg-Y179]|uniref:hypothetical protein n=1 Tax=Arthrobacter sp. zg-Y179 TaxID=2894188 RepID=UPI001E3C64FB|nr:hypothetical protein [Arthrobacter sp. zg-Y179]MCC9174302.1 hypothetical protein [Arthrobacter sp. zg-Y179]
MTFSLMSWILVAWLVATCLSVAVPVWKRAGQPSGPSRRSLLAGLMEAASLAGLLRLVVPWTPGSVALWVVAVVVLAAAVAGAVLRWPVLPGRVESQGPVRETASGASTGPEDAESEGSELEGAELVPEPDIPAEASGQSRRPQSATVGTATAETEAGPVAAGQQGTATEAAAVERSRRAFLPVRERAAAPDTGKSDPGSPDPGKSNPGSPDPGMPRLQAEAGKPRRKSEAGKKMKKEPGNLALAGNAALLLAVVVISFLAG